VTEEEIQKLTPLLEVKRFRKDEIIFKEKQPTRHLRMIKKGKVEISKTTPDGWKQTLAVLGNNTFLGELAILEKREHQATAKAIEDTESFLSKRMTSKDWRRQNLS
jgi:CRP/FNR family transcriptional regulator